MSYSDAIRVGLHNVKFNAVFFEQVHSLLAVPAPGKPQLYFGFLRFDEPAFRSMD